MENQENIKDIEISEMCIESSPCKHYVKITYTDGTEEEKCMGWESIEKIYKLKYSRSPTHN